MRIVFSPTGQVTGRSAYLPFGETLNQSGSLPRQRFTGQERDGEAGMDYFHARNLQTRTGRMNAPDPLFDGAIANPQGWNRYSYVMNSPLVFTDPTGANADAEQPKKCSADFCSTNVPIGWSVQISWSWLTSWLWPGVPGGPTGGGDGPKGPGKEPPYPGPTVPSPAPTPSPTPTPSEPPGAPDDSEESSASAVEPCQPRSPRDLASNIVNLSAGFGDGLLLVFGPIARDALGIDNVDESDGWYMAGSWASVGVGAARIAYAGLAKAGAAVARSGMQASLFRNQLKAAFRLGFGSTWRSPNLAKYPTDAALRAAAGRTNIGMNAYGAGVAASGAAGVTRCR